jgi:hypothetical protein
MAKVISVLYSHKDSVWKLADFGLTSEGASNMNLTTKYARGTTGYRAPELVKPDGKAVYNKKLDIWSMGCILYELATGTPAFTSDGDVLLHRYLGKEKEVCLGNAFNEHSKKAITKNIVEMLQIAPSDRPSASVLSQEFVRQCQSTQIEPETDDHQEVTISTITKETRQTLPATEENRGPEQDGILSGDEAKKALVLAAMQGDVQTVKKLLDAKVEVGARDEWANRTPLHWAARNRHLEVLKMLLDAKADALAQDKNGWTALHCGAYRGHTEVVKMLLEANVNVEVQDNTGRTALDMAREKGHFGVFWLLSPISDIFNVR